MCCRSSNPLRIWRNLEVDCEWGFWSWIANEYFWKWITTGDFGGGLRVLFLRWIVSGDFGSGLRVEILELDCKWGFCKWIANGDFGGGLRMGILEMDCMRVFFSWISSGNFRNGLRVRILEEDCEQVLFFTRDVKTGFFCKPLFSYWKPVLNRLNCNLGFRS